MPLLIRIFAEKDAATEKEKSEKLHSKSISERPYSEVGIEVEKGREKDSTSNTGTGTNDNSNNDGIRSRSDSGTSNNSNSGSGSSSSSSSSSGSVNSNATIAHIFDGDMIQLIMQDVIGMTAHGITSSSSSSSSSSTAAGTVTSATSGTSSSSSSSTVFERTLSQEIESKSESSDVKDGIKREDGSKVHEKEEGDRGVEKCSSSGSGSVRESGSSSVREIGSASAGGEDMDRGIKREGGDKDRDSAHGQSDASSLKIELLKVFIDHFKSLCIPSFAVPFF